MARARRGGLALGSASVVAPFTYTEIVWMVLAGWIFFGDVPGVSTVIGGAVVIVSGLWLLWQERRRSPAGSATGE